MTNEDLYQFAVKNGGFRSSYSVITISHLGVRSKITLGAAGKWLTRFNADGTQDRKRATPENLMSLAHGKQPAPAAAAPAAEQFGTKDGQPTLILGGAAPAAAAPAECCGKAKVDHELPSGAVIKVCAVTLERRRQIGDR